LDIEIVFLNKKKVKNYIITEVLFKLKKTDKVTIPQYKDLIQALQNKRNISLSDIRNEVIAIRNKKLPDPRFISSCGSFFKNPIVKKEITNKVLNIYPNAPIYEVDKENSKIGAGFLIDVLGFKGKTFGNIYIHENNALVLINKENKASFTDLEDVISLIKNEVKNKFEIDLEIEPVVI
jgi:UDP-N-acetylmuramate dehydrogenase